MAKSNFAKYKVPKNRLRFYSRDEFRYCHSAQTGDHPHYVFGIVGKKYASFGLTTHPKPKYPTFSLHRSPNPNNYDPNFIQKKYFLLPITSYEKRPEVGWRFDSRDMPLIRKMKKQSRNLIQRKLNRKYSRSPNIYRK